MTTIFRPRIDMGQKNWNQRHDCVGMYAQLPRYTLRRNFLPIQAVDPGGLSKSARASQGLGAGSAKGWVSQGRVFVPAEAEWVPAFLDEVEAFTGKKGGKDDRTDAFVYICNFAIGSNVGGGQVADLPESSTAPELETDPYLMTPVTIQQMMHERHPIPDWPEPTWIIRRDQPLGWVESPLMHQ